VLDLLVAVVEVLRVQVCFLHSIIATHFSRMSCVVIEEIQT
jgi:hypothetical protein